MMQYVAYLVTAASIVGTVANSYKKRWCFCIWLCTNAFWCVYNAVSGQTAQSLLYLFNFIMAIVGLVQWRRKADKEHTERITNIPMTEIDREEFARIVTHANAAEILEIVCELEAGIYARLPVNDIQFCKSQIEWRYKELLEHYDKYKCLPE